MRDVVEEDALAHRAHGDCGAEFAVAGAKDGGCGFGEERAVKGFVVHG